MTFDSKHDIGAIVLFALGKSYACSAVSKGILKYTVKNSRGMSKK